MTVICLAAPAAAQAGSTNSETVNGQYCNDLCKAYMAWSNRVLAITQPSYARPQMRVALPQSSSPKKMDHLDKPERMTQQTPKSHRPANLDSFAQLPAGSRAAMDRTSGDDGSAAYAGAQMGRMLAADAPAPELTGLRGSTADAADMRLVSMTDPRMAGPTTVGDASGSTRSKMPSIWIMLAAAALLAFFGHGWLKRRAEASEGIR
ncbi:hypothetical protein S58_67900 [Bradyrhizobium oligotrophicum S58]|uniref:Transmembrane protein n=2 Tax=Bradyrhizobium oligotrophicum TaxID=44255 RepID=M4ZFW6_9BRAD|nr:hypothetical protein S58_67900 [Bradyrhizobium oligotrophicum S58]